MPRVVTLLGIVTPEPYKVLSDWRIGYRVVNYFLNQSLVKNYHYCDSNPNFILKYAFLTASLLRFKLDII